MAADLADLGHEIAVDDTGQVLVSCRTVALRRALRNLLENACVYGARATVRIGRDGEQVRIIVEDEGPGIAEADLERVFEPFVRLEPSRSADTGGTGLGLAIARSIVRGHGGDIRLENRGTGGLRATVALPGPSTSERPSCRGMAPRAQSCPPSPSADASVTPAPRAASWPNRPCAASGVVGMLALSQKRQEPAMANAHERFMHVAMEEARRSADEGNVAVGSAVVLGEEVVARGRNLVTTQSDPTAHAETVALRNAGAALGHTDFSGYTLYTTFEPCPMCCGAILASGVSTLVLGARFRDISSRWGDYAVENLLDLTGRGDDLRVITGVMTEQCLDVWGLTAS